MGAMMGFLRFAAGTPFAILVTVCLFVLMYQLVKQDELPPPPPEKERPVITVEELKPPPPPDDIPPIDEARRLIDDGPPSVRPPPEGPPPVRPPIDPGEIPGVPTGQGGRGPIAGGLPLLPILTQAPIYPASCLSRGVEGNAVVEYDVTNAGDVINARIVSATDRCFERAALRAVEGWKYRPVNLGDRGALQATGLQQRISFTIDE